MWLSRPGPVPGNGRCAFRPRRAGRHSRPPFPSRAHFCAGTSARRDPDLPQSSVHSSQNDRASQTQTAKPPVWPEQFFPPEQLALSPAKASSLAELRGVSRVPERQILRVIPPPARPVRVQPPPPGHSAPARVPAAGRRPQLSAKAALARAVRPVFPLAKQSPVLALGQVPIRSSTLLPCFDLVAPPQAATQPPVCSRRPAAPRFHPPREN